MFNRVTHPFSRCEIVKWIVESFHPLSIVNDRGFKALMLTGCPDYWLPSMHIVTHDIQAMYMKTHEGIAELLSVSADAWQEE